MTLPNNDTTRCAGHYEGISGEFGRTLHPECIGCQRRVTGYPAGYWYLRTPEFVDDKCQNKIFNTEGN